LSVTPGNCADRLADKRNAAMDSSTAIADPSGITTMLLRSACRFASWLASATFAAAARSAPRSYEVTQFLQAMAGASETDRRSYERIGGDGAEATLHMPGKAAQRVAINDISRGGLSLRCELTAAAGTEVQIELPGVAGAVGTRIVRSERGMLALAFRQDATILARVDRALAHIGALGGKAAA
jgi:methyl-accepting chemotaxis protein